MRRPATALRLRRALRATVHAARRSRASFPAADTHLADARPAVAHIVADLDDIECASEIASALAWRRRALHVVPATAG